MVRLVISMVLVAATASSAVHAAGDAKKGTDVFQQQCQLCHNADRGGPNGLGPNLFGVVGRKAASVPNFYYSPALKNSKIVWSEAMLKKWVAAPQKVVPGTRMVFVGLANPGDAADVVAFLNTRK